MINKKYSELSININTNLLLKVEVINCLFININKKKFSFILL